MSAQTITVEIQAPLETVWAAVADVRSWPKWTPSVARVERLDDGPLRTGSRTRVKQPRMTSIVWEVTSLEANREFTWVGRSPGVSTTARHILDASTTGGGGTRLTLSVEHQGPLAGLVARLTRKRTMSYLNLEANGMKSSSESH